MPANLTRIETIFLRDRINHYTRFGRPVTKTTTALYRGFEYYKPGQLLGYVQWYGGEYGSRLWRFLILVTMSHRMGQQGLIKLQEVPGVKPGAQIILDLEGSARVKMMLKAIDQIEHLGLDPADISPAYYGHLHQRIMTNRPYHRYTMEQHKSFMQEREGLKCEQRNP